MSGLLASAYTSTSIITANRIVSLSAYLPTYRIDLTYNDDEDDNDDDVYITRIKLRPSHTTPHSQHTILTPLPLIPTTTANEQCPSHIPTSHIYYIVLQKALTQPYKEEKGKEKQRKETEVRNPNPGSTF